jgi:hypothetical protein
MKAEGFTLYCADPLRMPAVKDSSVQTPLTLLWRADLKLDRGSPSTKRGDSPMLSQLLFPDDARYAGHKQRGEHPA